MSFKLPLKRSAKIIQIGLSSEYYTPLRSTTTLGRPNIIPLDTITSSPSHGVSLNTSTSEITLSANKYYMGFGFFTVRRSTSLNSNENFHVGAFDSSSNLIDITQGFLCNTGAYTFYGDYLDEFDGDSKSPAQWSINSTANETFKFQKATGGSDFVFRMALSSTRNMYVMTNSVLYILEMD